MIPNGKKVRDNFVKISLDYYENQVIKAHAELAGLEPSKIIRQLALTKLNELMFNDQPIAMILPAQNKVELPMSNFFATQQVA